MTDSVAEARYWRDKVTEATRTQLESVQKAATNWSTLLGALLGAYGFAAFAGGTNEIDGLEDWAAYATKGMISVAAVLLIGATYFAARASGRLAVRRTTNTTWQQFRRDSIEDANRAANDLRIAKVLGLVTAAVVLAGAGFVLWGPTATSPASNVIADNGEAVVCGPLSESDKEELVVTAGSSPMVLEPGAVLLAVTKCP